MEPDELTLYRLPIPHADKAINRINNGACKEDTRHDKWVIYFFPKCANTKTMSFHRTRTKHN